MTSESRELCGAVNSCCVCVLNAHGDDVAHQCGAPSLAPGGRGCGGSWFGVPGTDAFRVVSYPGIGPLELSGLEFLTAAPVVVRRGGVAPLFVEVPSDEIDSLVPGDPTFDALMERARLENPGAGLLLIPQELAFDSLAIAQNLPSSIQSEDPALVEMLAGADAEVCPVCGGSGCDMFFCYVTGK